MMSPPKTPYDAGARLLGMVQELVAQREFDDAGDRTRALLNLRKCRRALDDYEDAVKAMENRPKPPPTGDK